ncbi:MAG: SpoIID/LytB domain-containing protein [Bacillota bacterium]
MSGKYHALHAGFAASFGRARRYLPAAAVLLAVAGLVSWWAAGTPPQARPEPEPPGGAGRVELSPQLVEKYSREPTITIFDHRTSSRVSMPIERYIERVVAGETVEGWKHATLAAQAIVARTFTLRSIESPGNTSRQLHGTDACTSKDHFQAYSPQKVDTAIRQAVSDTRGMILAFEDELVLSYFSSSSGGMTAALKEGFPFMQEEAPYLVPRPSPDREIAPAYAAAWTTRVSRAALRRVMGARAGTAASVVIESRGPSGRAEIIRVGQSRIHAAVLRRRLGPEVLRSTMITSISVGPTHVIFRGRGWGHGVGLDQWGAEAMAREGRNFEEIVAHYFPGAGVVKLWE